MSSAWTALVGVLAGGLVTLASTWLQQIRTWRRDDRVRSETRAAEQRREERRDVLKLFIDFLAACNRANVLHAFPKDEAGQEAIRQFSDLVDERWAAVQGGGVVFMAVGHDDQTREAISGLIDATETLTAKLRGLPRPTAEHMHDFSTARRQCERAMRDYLARLGEQTSDPGVLQAQSRTTRTPVS